MKLSSQRGVALVITLIFLSIITFLAVAFLATARRDKSSMAATQNQTGSKLMADVALARAQAEILGKMMARSNVLGIEMMVSRNFINLGGFNTAQPAGQVDTNNVNYDYTQAGVALNQNQFIQNVANLWFDPRPPVFVKTNKFGPLDPRFYLDLNRNGRFDTNGYRRALDRNGNPISNGAGGFVTNFLRGDPEWIGVLARPELPHSSSNQFVGRIAYVVVPVGLTLDINYLHNQTKQLGPGVDGFLRNQGVGSWELNLAAFLRDLNTNNWSYFYDTNLGAQSIIGGPGYDAFFDAKDILTNRYGGTYNNLSSFANLFTVPAATAFQTDGIDGYGAGPLMDTLLASGHIENLAETARKWSGSDSPRKVMNIDDLLVLGKTPPTFIAHLSQTLTNRSSYDASTYYRLIEQLGTESGLELRGKLNLNYTNNPALNSAETNFVAWTPSGFFTNAADLMLRSYTNNLSITNIQIFPTNQYTPGVHRLLQLAANIYDSTSRRSVAGSTNDFPSVFRPIFRKDNNNNVFITGYLEETNAAFLSYRYFDLVTVASNSVPNLDTVNIYGVPCVIGAKKGLPNFNEYSLQTAVRVTRKLQFLKLANAATPYRTNQMYIFSITNFLGVEAWNSYTQAFPRAVQIIATNFSTVRLTNENGIIPNSVNPLLLRPGNRLTLGPNTWNGFTGTSLSGNFQIPILTYVPILPTSRYRPDRPASQIFDTNLVFDATATGFPIPNVGMLVSNRLVFAVVDTSVNPNRVLDMVSLSDINVGFNINEELNRPVPIFQGVSSAINRLWRTNRVNGSASLNSPTEGIATQIDVGLNNVSVTASEWRSFNAQVNDQAVSMVAFRSQMTTNTPYATNFYAPFEPTVVFVKSFSLQANDPLVHYTSKDLTDPKTANVIDFINPPNPPASVNIFTNISLYNIGKVNTRYSPWINPLKGIDPDIGLDPAFKDPLIYNSDNWDFSTNKFPTIGWLGRVHRGTPWQTVYFKSAIADPQKWVNAWGSTMESHPTNDWRLADLFTVAPNDNAARGLLSVNQTGQAAWSAGLGGMLVLSNAVDNAVISPRKDRYVALPIEPASVALTTIVDGVNRYRAKMPGRTFRSVGEVLGTPELTIKSPLLNLTGDQTRYGISDAAYERIPLQLMSLLKLGDPRFVVYSYGQSLKPLNVHLGAQYFNMVTNYQITGEVATKTVLRVQGGPNGQYDARNPRVVIESFTLLPAE